MRIELFHDPVVLALRCNRHNGDKYDWRNCTVGSCECPFEDKTCLAVTATDWEKLGLAQRGETPKKPEEEGRGTVLHEAFEVINGQRQDQYGNPENNFGLIAEMWSLYLDVKIQPQDVALMMHLLKVARIISGTDKRDSYIDACGYLALAADMAEKKDDA